MWKQQQSVLSHRVLKVSLSNQVSSPWFGISLNFYLVMLLLSIKD
jgi:hypothetical protein